MNSLEDPDVVQLRIHIPGARDRSGPPAEPIPATTNPGMWLNMVNIEPPHLADLEIESVKKFIFNYKLYIQKYPRQLPRNVQQFI